MDHTREPKGIPTGGQFASRQHGEADLDLLDSERSDATAVALSRIQDETGLEFRQTDADTFDAHLGRGNTLSLLRGANRIWITEADGTKHFLPMSTSWEGGTDVWLASTAYGLTAIKKGANVGRAVATFNGDRGAILFPRDLPEDALPGEVLTAVPDMTRVEVLYERPDGERTVIRGLIRDIARYGSHLQHEPRRITTEGGWEVFAEPDKVRNIRVIDQSRVSPQW